MDIGILMIAYMQSKKTKTIKKKKKKKEEEVEYIITLF